MTKELENALFIITAIKGKVAFLTDETVKGIANALKESAGKKLKVEHETDDGGGVYMLELVEEKVNYQAVIDLFKKICYELPAPRVLSDGRKAAIRNCKAKLDELGITFETYFQKIQASDFLCRMGGGRGWKADFDFVMRSQQISKIIEGCYDNRTAPNRSGAGRISRKPTYDMEQIKKDAFANTKIKY